MAIQLVTSSAVVVAQHFNPSITGQHWLIENRILMPEELQVGAVFTDMFVQIPTRDFHFQVMPENCQFTFLPHVAIEKQQEVLRERLCTLVQLLPHTPYTAIGLNFVWHFFPDNESSRDACRRLFFSADRPLYRAFDTSDSQFGAYMSMDWTGYRLRLDVRPISMALPDGQTGNLIQFAFNYHQGLLGRPTPVRDIAETADRWDSVFAHAKSIVDIAVGANK